MPNPNPNGDLSKIWNHIFHFNIVDMLRVPQDIDAGEYTLSFRYVVLKHDYSGFIGHGYELRLFV